MKINNDNDHEKALAIIDFLFDALDLEPDDFYDSVAGKVDKLIIEVEKYEQHRWLI